MTCETITKHNIQAAAWRQPEYTSPHYKNPDANCQYPTAFCAGSSLFPSAALCRKNQFSVIRLSEKAGVRRFEVAQKQQERRRDGLRRQFPTGFVFLIFVV